MVSVWSVTPGKKAAPRSPHVKAERRSSNMWKDFRVYLLLTFFTSGAIGEMCKGVLVNWISALFSNQLLTRRDATTCVSVFAFRCRTLRANLVTWLYQTSFRSRYPLQRLEKPTAVATSLWSRVTIILLSGVLSKN